MDGVEKKMSFSWVNKKLAKRNRKKHKLKYVRVSFKSITRYMTEKEATWFLEDIGWFTPGSGEGVVPKDTVPQFGILVVQ